MTTFDATLISAIIVLVGCLVPILYERDRLRKRKIITVFLVSIIVVLALCLIAQYYNWESSILHISSFTSKLEEPIKPTNESTLQNNESNVSPNYQFITMPIASPENNWENSYDTSINKENAQITYENGNLLHTLSASIVHFPDISMLDYTVGGVWSLEPDFTQTDPYELTEIGQYVIVRKISDNNIIWYGDAHFGTVWSEDQLGNWEEKPELFCSPFTNKSMPEESYGTFAVDLSQYKAEISEGEYLCEIHIFLNGYEYINEVTFILEN